MSQRPWGIEFSPSVRNDLKRLDRQTRQRVYAALERLAASPQDASLRKLTGRGESRLRVGDWRVLLELDQPRHAIIVLHVLPRGRAYDR